jgi:hypothetical protein
MRLRLRPFLLYIQLLKLQVKKKPELLDNEKRPLFQLRAQPETGRKTLFEDGPTCPQKSVLSEKNFFYPISSS